MVKKEHKSFKGGASHALDVSKVNIAADLKMR